jgi:hypothetical protein
MPSTSVRACEALFLQRVQNKPASAPWHGTHPFSTSCATGTAKPLVLTGQGIDHLIAKQDKL